MSTSATRTASAASARPCIYDAITTRILECLDRGVIPWKMGWNRGTMTAPTNPASGTAYRGCNFFLLSVAAQHRGFDSNKWLTFKQAIDLKASPKKGSKSEEVVFWKQLTVADKESGEDKKIPMLKSYRVFNVAEIDNLPAHLIAPPVVLLPHERISAAQAIADAMPNPPALIHGGGRACYSPSSDSVTMPELGRFHTPEEYHSTLFHELGHSTGHLSRLSRDGITKNAAHFGNCAYAKEELIAEMTAAFLCAHSGIEDALIDNQAAYIAGWRKAIQADPKCVVTAAAAAQKAADYILGKSYAN